MLVPCPGSFGPPKQTTTARCATAHSSLSRSFGHGCGRIDLDAQLAAGVTIQNDAAALPAGQRIAAAPLWMLCSSEVFSPGLHGYERFQGRLTSGGGQSCRLLGEVFPSLSWCEAALPRWESSRAAGFIVHAVIASSFRSAETRPRPCTIRVRRCC